MTESCLSGFCLFWSKTMHDLCNSYQDVICENDFISIATSYICYFLLFYYILVLLFSFILAISDYSTLTYLIFTVFYSMEYTNKLKYTINHKYTLFYLPIQNNDDDDDDDKTSTIHNQYYWE